MEILKVQNLCKTYALSFGSLALNFSERCLRLVSVCQVLWRELL